MFKKFFLFISLVLLELVTISHTFAATSNLTIRLIDHVSNVSLGGQKIDAYEKASDGALTWRAVRTTESNGQAQFHLDGLGNGKKYVLLARPFGYPVKSDELNATGWYGFRVGKLQVQVIDGQTGHGKGGHNINLKRWQTNGNHTWAMSATTDALGWVKLDPPDAGKIPYVLTAVSTTDGLEKLSPQLWSGPAIQFRLDNFALVAQLQDGISGAALAMQWVEAWEKLTDGSQVLRVKRQTDTGGAAKFDLEGLGSGRIYLLKAKPYLQAVDSGELTAPGPRPLKAGKLQVQILDGRTGNPFAWNEVTLLEKQVDGSLKWIAKVITDGTGLLKLDPVQLGVRPYILRAVSKVDGTPKDSPEYAAPGSYSFKVGGAGLTVRLIDHVSDTWLKGQGVHAYEKTSDGTLVWRAVRTTDSEGTASFDLEGLGSGKVYVLQAHPFGYWVKSDEISTAGFNGFRVGTTLVTLTDANNAVPLVGKTITAFEKLPNGTLRSAMQGITNALGQAKFDLTGLGKGAVYVLRASNPFGETKDYFSGLLTWKGAFAFALQKGKTNEPDHVLPVVKISSPSQTDKVVAGGFLLQGTASDNVAMKEVRAILTLPSGEVMNLPANYIAVNQTWALSTGALPNPAPGILHVKVQGVDTSQNVSEVSLELSLVNDTTPPVIAVNAPADGSVVPTGAFLVSGALTDNTLSPTLTAKVSGGGLASPEERTIEVASGSGRWAVMVAPDVAFSTSPITLSLTAKDGTGNTVTKVLQLNPGDVYRQAWHVLQRTGYGGGPDQLAEVVQTGPVNYIRQQLSPGSVDDSAFTNRQTSWGNGSYLATGYLRHALYSRKQLQEVMTAFWDNHFSTHWFKHKTDAYELNEVAAFRAHALGNFRNLLEISAKSPAMLYTLDGILSYMGNPNENYARELMELHTMGVTGGYSQTDVVEVARAFTGWTVKAGAFYFDAAKHDNGAKTVLGFTIAANGGQMDGERILNLVARHASTANRICSKLVTYFVSDAPVAGLVSRCSSTFLAQTDASDQIAQVLMTILNSPEFLGATYRGQKIKTPLELAINSTRNLGGESNGDDLAVELARMGMDLYTNPSPTGYAETGDRWISPGQLLSRIRFLDRLLAATPATGATQVALLAQVQAQGLETAEGVVGYLLQLGLGPTVTKAQRELGLNLLTRNGALPYFNWAPDAEIRLRQLEKAVMTMPEYQYQ